MAKHQRRSFATENSPQPYHDEMHRQSSHQKSKLVTKPNLRYAKNPARSDARKNRNPRNEGHHAKSKNHTYPPHHQTSPPHAFSPPDSYFIVNATEPPTLEQIAAERERIRIEFFSTYDAMTGVRIATTLGGFFGLMVFLVIYKSRGERIETMKALNDPKIAAVAAAVMQEEEDRELQEALEATGLSIYPDDYVEAYPYRPRNRMMSLGNVSAPPTITPSGRFSSIGGYSSLLTPTQRRFSYAGTYRKSNSVESSRVFSAYPIDESFDYYMESDGDEADDEFDQITSSNDVDERAQRPQLSIPQRRDSRRSSNITCCSSESSYLERRCSAITLGLSPLPAISSRCPSTTNIWDYVHQPPDIQLTQPTPRVSPCSSERINDQRQHSFDGSGGSSGSAANRRWKKAQRRRSIDQDSFDSTSTYPERSRRFYYDEIEEEELAETTVLAQQINKLGLETRCLDDTMLKYTLNNTFQTNLLSNRRAPLASISSLKMSSIDYQDSSLRSPVSDSVFEETYADTDDDMDQFSTDSDVELQNADMQPLKEMKSRGRKSNGKTIARVERTEVDASTSTKNVSIAMQTSFTALNTDGVDLEHETICEIEEIGPQAQNNNRTAAENAQKLFQSGSNSSGSGNNNSNKYSRSTGNMAQAMLQKLDKSPFLSEPLNLHHRTVDDEPPKLHKSNSKTNISMQRMPLKASYCSSSSRSSSSCHSTT